MKFSEKKKAKMRKRNQRRINRCCSDMIGCTVDWEEDYVVIDQAKIKNVMYLLARNKGGNYAIYKIVSWCKYVKMSNKRILEKKREFSNYAYWKEHSTIEITDSGEIKEVRLGSYLGPYNMKNRSGIVCISILV